MIESLIEPFRFGFFRNGLAVVVIAGGLCGLIGTYVVLRGMSYIGHGLSHAIFGGAVASFVMNVNFYVGAGLWGLASVLMIHAVARRRTLGADAAIGVVTTASLAIGIALISAFRSFTRNFESALFGNVLGVGTSDVTAVAVTAAVVASLVFLRYRPLLFATFDPDVAEVSGVRTVQTDLLLSLALGATILVTMQVLGVLLIAAALVIPAATARLLTDRFGRMMALSVLLGSAAGFTGIYLSFFLNVASGPAVVLAESAGFLAAFLFRPARRRVREPQPAPG